MLKHFINHLKAIALLSLVVALAGAALATSSPTAAADCNGMSSVPCSLISVKVYNTQSDTPVNDATVRLVDDYNNVTYAYNPSANPAGAGYYLAYVTPGSYRVYVSAPDYYDFTATTRVTKPGEDTLVKAPLVVNSQLTGQ